MYSLLAVLETAATWALVRALEGGGRRWWLAFGAATTLALYTHNFAGLFLGAHLLACIIARRGLRPLLLTSCGVALLYAPWALASLQQVTQVASSAGWLGGAPPLWRPLITVVNLLLGAELRDGLLSPRFALEHAYLLAPALALLVFGWRALARRPFARLTFGVTLIAPLLLALLASQRTSVYVDKPFLAGALLLLSGHGLRDTGGRGRALPAARRRARPVCWRQRNCGRWW